MVLGLAVCLLWGLASVQWGSLSFSFLLLGLGGGDWGGGIGASRTTLLFFISYNNYLKRRVSSMRTSISGVVSVTLCRMKIYAISYYCDGGWIIWSYLFLLAVHYCSCYLLRVLICFLLYNSTSEWPFSLLSLFVLFLFLTCFAGLVYCMDFLEKNIDWLQSKLEPLIKGWHNLHCDKVSLLIYLFW